MCGYGEEGFGWDGWVEESNDVNGLIYCIVYLPTDSVFGLTKEHVYIPFSYQGSSRHLFFFCMHKYVQQMYIWFYKYTTF